MKRYRLEFRLFILIIFYSYLTFYMEFRKLDVTLNFCNFRIPFL